jgi:YVTN family beta-propeller protein
MLVAVNPSTNMIYVANANSNSLSVINGQTNTVTKTIQGLNGPYGVAVDAAANLVYVASGSTVAIIPGS